MPSQRYLTRLLTLTALLCLVPGCAGQARLRAVPPPASDLIVPLEPVPPIEVLTSAKAAADYQVSRDVWSYQMQAQLGRLCRWAADVAGAKVECPK